MIKDISLTLDIISLLFFLLSLSITFINGKNKFDNFNSILKISASFSILILADIIYIIFRDYSIHEYIKAAFYFETIVFIAKPLCIFFWTEYVGKLVVKNASSVKLFTIFTYSALFINIAMVLFNIFDEIIFIIDANGKFTYTIGLFIYNLINIASLCLVLGFVIAHRNKTSKNNFTLLVCFPIPIILAEVVMRHITSVSLYCLYSVPLIILMGVFEQFIQYREIDKIIDDAIANKSFEIYYQPIYSVKEQRFVSCEALLRLFDNDRGFISPERLISAAEETGKISKIFNIVVADSCDFIKSKEFQQLNLEYVNINLSMSQLSENNFSGKLQGMLRRYGVEASKICVEITETLFADNDSVVYDNIKDLNNVGIPIALDDYGSGLSNLYRMSTFPFSMIKLDKFLIQGINDPKIRSITSSTIKMLKSMNMKIVAEGVETFEQLNEMTDLNVDLIQGFYFSRPISRNKFTDLISSSESININ